MEWQQNHTPFSPLASFFTTSNSLTETNTSVLACATLTSPSALLVNLLRLQPGLVLDPLHSQISQLRMTHIPQPKHFRVIHVTSQCPNGLGLGILQLRLQSHGRDLMHEFENVGWMISRSFRRIVAHHPQDYGNVHKCRDIVLRLASLNLSIE